MAIALFINAISREQNLVALENLMGPYSFVTWEAVRVFDMGGTDVNAVSS